MGYKNTNSSFGSVTKALHWSIASCFLVAYCSAYYGLWFTIDETYENWVVTQLHQATGTVAAALIAVRVAWRFANILPNPPPGPWFEHLAARVVHAALYVVMIVMPLTGYLGTRRDTEYLGITRFDHTSTWAWIERRLGMTWEGFEAPLDYLHRDIGGALLVWMLIAVHVAGALYHHFWRRDDTLSRMLPARRADAASNAARSRRAPGVQ